MPQKGYTWDEARYQRFLESGEYEKRKLRMRKLGKNKTPEQIEKMRLAKLGKPKTETQRSRMSQAHKERWAKYRAIKQTSPDLTRAEVWDLVNTS